MYISTARYCAAACIYEDPDARIFPQIIEPEQALSHSDSSRDAYNHRKYVLYTFTERDGLLGGQEYGYMQLCPETLGLSRPLQCSDSLEC